jgi:long-chain fatty acid transport protein
MNHNEFTFITVLALLSGAFCPSALAGGFQQGAPTAKALGLGGASTGLIGDPASIFSNSASLSYMHGTNLALGATVTMPDYEFSGVLPSTATTKMNPQSLFPPSVSLSHTFGSGLGFGITAGIPYQVKTSWAEEWIGSPIVISSEVRAVQVSPAVAFRIGRNLAVGVGFDLMFVRMDHSRRYGDVADSSTGRFPTMSMTGSADVTYGFNAGLMYSPGKALSFGFALTSKVTAEVNNGTVSYTGSVGGSGASTSQATTFATSITLPEHFRVGAMLRPFDELVFTGEMELTRWSGVKGVTIRMGSPSSTILIDQSGWKDVLAYKGGVELTIADVMLRGGIGVEPSPVPDEELRPSMPDGDRFHYNVGIGYAVEEGLILDVGVEVNKFSSRTVTASKVAYGTGKYFNGTYALASTVLALTISYSWK